MTAAPAHTPPPAGGAHLLIVDDDDRIRSLLERFLAREGFRTALAANALEARAQMARFAFDLVLLDVMMPGEDGLSLLRHIRAEDAAPVLMLSARGAPDDRITGLGDGADDYLAKPFEPAELVLRIRAILRRVEAARALGPPRIRLGQTSFDGETGELKIAGALIDLTDREIATMRVLARHLDAPVSREDLARRLGGLERSVDVTIARLRRKLDEAPHSALSIETARGIGYRLTSGHRQ